MLKKLLKGLCLFSFFIAFIAFLSAPITSIGWFITGKTKLGLWFDTTLIGLYGALIGMMLHTIFYDEMKISRRFLLALVLLACILLSTCLNAINLFFKPDLFSLLAFWWAIATGGFFFLSSWASDDPAQAQNKTDTA